MKNFLITGPPRCGKTTLITKVSRDFFPRLKFGGFITEELLEKGQRVGFKITSLPDKEEGLLARKGFSSPYRVGRYGINTEDLERIGCTSITNALLSRYIVIIDEVGKMELFSEKFKAIFTEALNSPNKVLATIMEKRNEFADRAKKRKDVKLVHLNRDNFEKVFREVQNWLTKLV